MACQRCGLCCIVCDMRLEEMTKENTPAVMDRMRWLNLHRCDTQIVTRKDGRKFTALRIPIMCVKLDQDKDGKYKCKDYENRPQLCKDFLCEKAFEKKPGDACETTG